MKIAMKMCVGALLALTLALAGCGGGSAASDATQVDKRINIKSGGPDAYDVLRTTWLNLLTGGSSINTSDPDIATQVNTITANAQTDWNSMITTSGRTSLWPDLTDWTQSTTITNSYTRLEDMAAAYANPGSSLYQNASLATAIIGGLDWLNANAYNAGIANTATVATTSNNWWDWQVGTPKSIDNSMTYMYSQLTATQISNYIAAIDHFIPNPSYRTNTNGTLSTQAETGANLMDKSLAVVLRGIIGKASSSISTGSSAISPVFLYVTTGDGFYVDGSFVQHTHVPYTGGYGQVLLDDMAHMLYLLNGSAWAITDPNSANVYSWVTNAFLPFMYDGAMMDMVSGRKISREFSSDHDTGRSIVGSLALLVQSLPANQAATIQSAIKGVMQRDTSFGSDYFTSAATSTPGILAGLPIYETSILKAIQNNSSITAAPEATQTSIYASMDRAVQRSPGFAFGLSMFSPRMTAFEYGNDENIMGWWTGVGMTYLYNADITQYDGNCWATINWSRLPGTTTDHSGSGTPKSFYFYSNPDNAVGGAALNAQYAVAGMNFAMSGDTGSALTGMKSWFMFGNYILAMGAGITDTGTASVETIVDNRKLDAAGDNALTINGTVEPTTLGWTQAIPSVQWAHLAGSVPGSDIGYYFPDQPTVTALRESRSGTWNAINTASGTTTVQTNAFASLALVHGAAPSGAAYTYVILPNYSAAQTAAFAANSGIMVLERSTNAAAVHDKNLGLTGIMFWNPTSWTVNQGGMPFVTSNTVAAVMMQQQGTDLQIAVSDPTQTNTGTVNIVINRAATALVSADPNVTVTQLSPTINLTINVNGLAGKSSLAHVTLSNTMTLSPTDNTYVRDGTYATTNYGTSTAMYIKTDAVSYNRDGLIKFDLSPIGATIDTATMNLVTSSIGQTTPMTNNAYVTTSDSWTQSTVTWNTMPGIGSLVASWTVPQLGSSVGIDVSSVAATAMSGDQLLSLLINSNSGYGSNGWMEYGTTLNTKPQNRPTLVVTFH